MKFSGLGWAIQSRLLVHRALERDDIHEVIRLNHLADAAYNTLTHEDARLYREWARPFVDEAMAMLREGFAALPGEDA